MTASRPSRRRVLALAAGALGTATLRGQALAAAPSFRRGVNAWPWFSLTREYPAPRTDYAWPPFQTQRPVPTEADLSRLAQAGFDFIRIPVDPGPFLADPDHRRRLLDDLAGAVRAAASAGLGVIVNLQPNEATHYWRSENLIASTAAAHYDDYRSLVAVVARRLTALGVGRLALEPVNEPPQACVSTTWPAVQQGLLAAARGAAPALMLVATGACGSMVPGLEALDPRSLAAFEPLLYTFHFYEPYLFSHQGAPWMREPVYRALNAVPWPASAGSLYATLAAVRARMASDREITPAAQRDAYALTQKLMKQYFDADPDRRFVDHHLDRIATWAARHAVAPERILMGEFGALHTTGSYVSSNSADRVRYVRDVRAAAEARGFGWAFWNLFDGMGLMDEGTRRLDADVVAALGLTSTPRP